MGKRKTRLSLILLSVLVIILSVLLCGCGVDTANIAGSASQVNQSTVSVEENITDDENTLTDIKEDDDGSYDEDIDYDNEIKDEDVEEELDEEPQDSGEPVIEYVLNTNTKKFHDPDCYSVDRMKDKNKRVIEATREEVINMGYEPCGNCNP